MARDAGRVLTIAPEHQGQFAKDELARWSKLIARYGVTAQ